MINATQWSPRYNYSQPSSVAGYPGTSVFNAEMYLVEVLANSSYSDATIQQQSPYLIMDPHFNAVLSVADVALNQMFDILDKHSSVRRCVGSRERVHTT
jgi:hypothetical protein